MKINAFNVAAHFAGKDSTTREIYDRLLKTSRQSGTVKEDPKKTSIHLVNKTAFAGVAVRKNSIMLTIKSDRELSSPRIHKSEQVSAHRFHHEIKLASPEDVDVELTGWLRAAFELSA